MVSPNFSPLKSERRNNSEPRISEPTSVKKLSTSDRKISLKNLIENYDRFKAEIILEEYESNDNKNIPVND
jgi:hypothetical protein